MEAIKANELVPMPQDMEGGKDKIVFGNIQQIYEWHKSTFSPDVEKCLSESSSYIGQLFVKYVRKPFSIVQDISFLISSYACLKGKTFSNVRKIL